MYLLGADAKWASAWNKSYTTQSILQEYQIYCFYRTLLYLYCSVTKRTHQAMMLSAHGIFLHTDADRDARTHTGPGKSRRRDMVKAHLARAADRGSAACASIALHGMFGDHEYAEPIAAPITAPHFWCVSAGGTIGHYGSGP